jgi:hypothetical protein
VHDDSPVERALRIIPKNLAYTATWNADVDEWLRGIPDRVDELAQQLSLEIGRPYEPGGFTSWVAPARLADGTDAVLKIVWPHREAEHEADALPSTPNPTSATPPTTPFSTFSIASSAPRPIPTR